CQSVAPIAPASGAEAEKHIAPYQEASPPPKVFRVSLSSETAVRVRSLRSAPVNLKVEGDLPNPREGHGWMFSVSEQLKEEYLSVEDAVVTVTNQQFSLPIVNY
ncbi:MAG: hypothetical protein GY696_30890, partial [Gammaproteobacteria bacterium]|nr:hypothetical protein [Gammaproteobacteria bacterium]